MLFVMYTLHELYVRVACTVYVVKETCAVCVVYVLQFE